MKDGESVYGYRIPKPKAVPRIVFACKATMEQYDWKNTNGHNTIEFSVANSRRRVYALGGGQPVVVEGETFSCNMGDSYAESRADNGVAVEVVSVAAEFEGLTYTGTEFGYADISDGSVLLLPAFPQKLPEQRLTYIKNILYKIIECYADRSAASDTMCAAYVLTLMFELDRTVRQSIELKKEKYTNYYVSKAESIILDRFHEKITIKSIASELGITPNYLSAIFKASVGIGFSDRLLEVRMKKAEAMLKEGSHTAAEIALKVGYEDESHLRRRFRQYFGVSIHDYRLINKELTLYHKKPQRRTE